MFISRQTLAAALALGSAMTQTDAAEWKTHTYDADGFTADFSGEIDVDQMEARNATPQRLVGSTSYTQMSDDRSVGFIVAANHFADGEAINVSAVARRTMKSYACKDIVHDARIDVGGATAREMRATGCFKGTKVGARFFKRDQWLYQVVYLIQKEQDRADAEHFLASFKLVPVAAKGNGG
ncbi:MAG: hypothetical protein SGI91_09800 [Alphaproteobacteria bacterium]|nr:hypothetical protein [Alphaproteobacteria bacterium]